MEDSIVTLILSGLGSGGIVVLVANILTLFVDDSKLAKAGPFIGAVGKFLNLLALNVGANKNTE